MTLQSTQIGERRGRVAVEVVVMMELLRSNNPVLLSWSVVLLKDADIETVVLDGHMSILEGSIGALPRRLMVDGADEVRARHILIEAGVVSEPS